MQTLEQVLRQYALNPLVQTKIELFEGRKPEVSPCASQATASDIAGEEAGSRQVSPFDIACVYCNEPIDSREVHTTMNGPACTNCVEAAAVRSTADSSLANNSVAHTPAIIGKLNINNPA